MENQEYLKKTEAILINHNHPNDIVKKYEVFQIQFENPTINSSLKYTVNNKIIDEENNKRNKKTNGIENKTYKIFSNAIRKSDLKLLPSNQCDNNTNNALLDVNGHFKAEMLEMNKITCSFRKLKSNFLNSNKNSSVNYTSNNAIIDENNINFFKPPFQYASINNKNLNIYNTYNSNLNKSNVNNYYTRETITRRKTLYQSINHSILNCSSPAAKIFWSKQEQTAKNIEEGFEKLQKLARNLKIIENNQKNSKLINILKYEDLFDILEFKGMEKEKEIIDKNVQKKKRIHSEIKKPIEKSLKEIEEKNPCDNSQKKKDFYKNNYGSHCKLDINDKEINYNSDRELPTFNKENFLSMATINSECKNLREFDLISSYKKYCKEDYNTNINNENDNFRLFKEKKDTKSIKVEIEDSEKINVLNKLRQLDNFENDDFTVENKNNKIYIEANNPFKSLRNPYTASKGLPPRDMNIFASNNKKKDNHNYNLTTNKKQKIHKFNNSPNLRKSFKIKEISNHDFNEKIEMAAKMPFAIKKKTENNENKTNLFFENSERGNFDKIIINSDFPTNNKTFVESSKIVENHNDYASSSLKLDSNVSDSINYKIKNPFKKESNKNQTTDYNNDEYNTNYAYNNYISNTKEASLFYKTNDNNYKSNYETLEMKDAVNENSNITSASIISCNIDFDSNIRSSSINNYNCDTYNLKTNEIYGSNSFGDYNSENAIENQFYSNISNHKSYSNFKTNYKDFKNDFDNYEEYESAMRRMKSDRDQYGSKQYKFNKKINNSEKSTNKTSYKKCVSKNSNNNKATESDYISDYSKNSKLSSNSQINNYSYITKSSISDFEI